MTSILRLLGGRGARLLAVAATAGALALAPAGSAHAAAGSPFDPHQGQIFASKSADASTETALWELAAGPAAYSFTAIGGQSDLVYNALSYNTDDNYLYAIVTNPKASGLPAGALIKIGASGGYDQIGVATFVDGFDSSRDTNMGAYNPDTKTLWVASAQGRTVHIIDADESSGTYGLQVDTFDLDATHDGVAEGSDWAFSQGELFSLGRDGFFRINDDGSTDGPFTAPNSGSSAGGNDQAGAAWTQLGDDLGFSYNGSGQVLRVRVSGASSPTPTFTVISKKNGSASGQNDGAASPGVVDLAITKTGELINDDTQVRYVLTITNLGSADSSGWQITDTLPAGLENIDVTGDGSPTVTGSDLEASGTFLAVDDTRVVTVVADIGDAESLDNVATVEGADPDPNLANNESAVSLDLPADPDDPEAPDTGAERTPMWPAYGALGAGLILAAGLGGLRLIGRRDS